MPPKAASERRRQFLAKVEQCVCQDRQNAYGDAEDNFKDIADMANIMFRRKLKEPLDSLDVALFSCCIKMARLSTDPRHIDSLVDLAGYAACGGGIVASGD